MRQMPPSHYRSAPRAHQGANRRLLAPYMFARTERPTRLRVRATPFGSPFVEWNYRGLGTPGATAGPPVVPSLSQTLTVFIAPSASVRDV
jgi:hypothetical protein